MPPDQTRKLLLLILFVLVVGVVLIVTVILLLRAWRRQLIRAAQQRRAARDDADIWKAGGERLIAKMSPFPRPEHGMPFDDPEENRDNGDERRQP